MKTSIGASLPKDLYAEFLVRAGGFQGGKSALIREALRTLFAASPLTVDQKNEIEVVIADLEKPQEKHLQNNEEAAS